MKKLSEINLDSFGCQKEAVKKLLIDLGLVENTIIIPDIKDFAVEKDRHGYSDITLTYKRYPVFEIANKELEFGGEKFPAGSMFYNNSFAHALRDRNGNLLNFYRTFGVRIKNG